MKDPDLYSDKSDREGEQDHEESDPEGLEKSEESDSDTSERQDDSYIDLDPNEHLRETPYLEQSQEELGEVWNRGWGWEAAILLSFERQQKKHCRWDVIVPLGYNLLGFVAAIFIFKTSSEGLFLP